MLKRARTQFRARPLQAALVAAAVAGASALVAAGATSPAGATSNDDCAGPNTVPPTTTTSTSTTTTSTSTTLPTTTSSSTSTPSTSTSTSIPPTSTSSTTLPLGFGSQSVLGRPMGLYGQTDGSTTSSSSTSSSSTSSTSTSSTSTSSTSTSSTSTSTTAPTTTSTTIADFPHITGAIVTGAMAPGGPHVKVYKASDRSVQREFFAYAEAFRGGVNVALGDVNNDNWTDIITGAGPGGGSHVKVFSGRNGAELASFYAYPAGFDGGVNVASCDVNNDGRADIITGTGGNGGPHVKVFSGTVTNGTSPDQATLASFFAYPAAFNGGVRVGAADVDGDGRADVITGAGPGGGPHLKIFKLGAVALAGPTEIGGWFAYNGAFSGGIYVGGSVDNGTGRIITGAGPGGGQHVRIFEVNGQEIAGLIVTPGSTVGATVAIGNGDADEPDEFVVGNASGSPQVRLFELSTAPSGPTTAAYPGFAGGVSVALGDI